MPVAQLASKVVPTGFLESSHTLALFTYASQTSDDRKLQGGLPYSTKLREGASLTTAWDEKQIGPGITLVGPKKLDVQWPSYDSIVKATRSFQGSDKFYWELTFTGDNSLRAGVLDGTVTDLKRDLWQVGYSVNSGGGVYIKGSSQTSVAPYSKNSTFGFALDMKKRTLTYYLHGSRIGVVFTNLPDKVWPAVSNGTGPTSITVKFGLPWPKDADLA